MQNGFVNAAYPLLAGLTTASSSSSSIPSTAQIAAAAFNPHHIISTSSEAVIKAEATPPLMNSISGGGGGTYSPKQQNGAAGNTVASGKKRPRPTASSSFGGVGGGGLGELGADSPDGEGEGDDDKAARKRRLALSCSECKRRKIKCDRKQPCSSCIRRKCPHSCSWDDDPDSTQPYALNSDVRHLARRLAHLESLFQATNPGLLPKDPSSNTVQPSPASFDSPNSPHRRNTIDDSAMREIEDEAARQSHSDTEDAAHQLEDVAFAARVPVLRAINAAQSSAGGSVYGVPASRRPTRVGPEYTRALTSIIAEPLSYDQDGRPRSAVRLGMDLAVSTQDLPGVRSGSMAQIFAVLPGKEIADFLLHKYFTEIDWDYKPIDEEAFLQEHDRYREMLLDGREDLIDPLWVAVFCMVLALSLEGFWSRPGGAKNLNLFRGLSERELQDLPSVWHDAALRALQLGEWGGTPRIRTIQTVILFGQYIQIASSSGQQGRFLGWAASAIRVAQRLGLHRLGTNPETMPPDDPALPPGKNSLKREMGVRLFNMLVCIDSLLSDSTHRCYLLHPSQYNTARPTNLNWSDFSRTEWRTINPHSMSVHTDASFEIAQCNIAAQIRRALDHLVLGTLPFSYHRVLEQDREYKHVFEELPDVFSERSPPLDSVRLRYQRALLHEGVYSRLIRLHRPFLSRGYNHGSQFRFSTDQCVRAARLIVASNYGALKITNSVWWIYTSTLGSAIVLFMDLFHSIDTDASEQAIKERKEVLVKASIIFNTQVISPALRAVVEQGRRILGGLFLAEEGRRTQRAAHALVPGSAPSEIESFAHVLQRISREASREEQISAATQQQDAPFTPAPATYVPPSSNPQYLPVEQNPEVPLQQFEYWPAENGVQQQQDFTSFFDTLASEDWTAAFGTGTGSDSGAESGLLGQMAATW
ncbi:hypothetical protein T439DRAFT_326177 [Meredithblackwellia eburnea MCA 4105]